MDMPNLWSWGSVRLNEVHGKIKILEFHALEKFTIILGLFCYRLIIFNKSLCSPFYRTNLTDFFPQQQFHIEFLFKFFDKMLNKNDFLKIINLYEN